MVLGYVDQLFVQSMLTFEALNERKTIDLYNKCISRIKGPRVKLLQDGEDLEKRLSLINDELSPIGFQMKTVFSPWEGAKFWGMCNVLEDAAVAMSSIWSKKELLFFYKVMEALRESDGMMALVEARDMAREDYSMSIVDASTLLTNFTAHKWLKNHKRDGQAVISFGPRAMLELPAIRTWLLQKNREGALDVAKPEPETDEEAEVAVSERRHPPSRPAEQQEDGEDEDEIQPNHKQQRQDVSDNEEEEVVPQVRRKSSRRLRRMSDY